MPTKFLVVDDEPDVEPLIRHVFRRELREGEYEFVFAADGLGALDRLAEHEDVEVVLTDLNMPRMDGLVLLARIAELDRHLKVIVVSAYGDLANLRTAMNRGAFDFVTKPIDFGDLGLTIAKSLRELAGLRRAQALQRQVAELERELDLARRIQLAMLPTAFPARAEFALHALAVPAREVGGDFYDFVEAGPGRLAFAVGDVAGKGLGAALFMALSRMIVRATAAQDLPVEVCVRAVNRLVAAETRAAPSMFVTLLFGVLDARTGEVAYCSAGHLPPLVVRSDGTTALLPTPFGLALGMVEDFAYEPARVSLGPSETLLLYSDGVTEAFNAAREEFSEERLLAHAAAAGRTPDALVAHVLDAVRAHAAGAPQSDDVTMLALQYHGAPAA